MRAELDHEVSNAAAGHLCLLLHRRFGLPGHQHSFEYFFFCCRQAHQAAGGEINETGSFSSCHRSLKREGFRSVLLKEWEDTWRALSLHGQLSAPADVVWLRSVPVIAGVLYTGTSNF